MRGRRRALQMQSGCDFRVRRGVCVGRSTDAGPNASVRFDRKGISTQAEIQAVVGISARNMKTERRARDHRQLLRVRDTKANVQAIVRDGRCVGVLCSRLAYDWFLSF